MQAEKGKACSLKKTITASSVPSGTGNGSASRGRGGDGVQVPRRFHGGSGSFLWRAVAFQRSGCEMIYLIYGFYNHFAGILQTNSCWGGSGLGLFVGVRSKCKVRPREAVAVHHCTPR